MEYTFSAELQKFEANLWTYYLPVPDAISSALIKGKDRRVLCKLNNILEMQCALMPSGEGWFIMLNQKILKQLTLKLEDTVMVVLQKDLSEFGMAMPEVLEILLAQDELFAGYFTALTAGKQRNLIYIVSSVKNKEFQLNKALAIAEHLKEVKGNLDFKLLNLKIKEYNSR